MRCDSLVVTTWLIDKSALVRLGATMIPVPRHVEIGPGLSEDIFKQCEPELGERWWK